MYFILLTIIGKVLVTLIICHLLFIIMLLIKSREREHMVYSCEKEHMNFEFWYNSFLTINIGIIKINDSLM